MPKVWAQKKPKGAARSAELTAKPSAGANGLLLNLRTLESDVSLFGADLLQKVNRMALKGDNF